MHASTNTKHGNDSQRYSSDPQSARLAWMVAFTACICMAVGAGFWLGQSPTEKNPLPPMLAASSASTDTMAVSTGPISDDAEGIFFLDFITGDLQCLVYYPRSGAFGARYFTNVAPQLGGVAGKNAKYLMVTGGAISKSSTGGARPGASLVYVTDTSSGVFAAYAVPWDRNAEKSGRAQSGPLVYAGGGPIRNFNLGAAQGNQPAAIVDPNRKP